MRVEAKCFQKAQFCTALRLLFRFAVKRTEVTNTPAISDADLARLEQLRNIPIELVADKASMLIMAATMTQCVIGLAVSESEAETCQILGAAFQLMFMLGRQSTLN